MSSETLTLPERIRRKLEELQKEVDQIVLGAEKLLKTQLPDPIQFEFVNSASRDVLTDYERAQSVSFLTRFEHLPNDYTVTIVQLDEKYYIENMGFLRHALNEFRPLIQNEKDSVYYQRVHSVWHSMLILDDPNKGTTIRVFDRSKNDVTATYIQWLNEHNKAITFVLKPLDYEYLYNGILQHSDPTYSRRYLQDYTSGELNYILWKHVHVLSFIREMLRPYYLLIKILTSPKFGTL